ncbi:hypothetical protein Afil01_30440 [Actinorhabdospora filicis]|uniref:Uncharacterized protein n=1 Tax=Actinorhabdospora filicis TaxID=1785913 RepID=A0A9W6SLQ7_9ACTN|nr:hypothetical protein Afil01_30440 [Actinorhabdospora filicis]
MRLMARVTDRLLNRLVPAATALAVPCVASPRICSACSGGLIKCCVYYDGTGDCPPPSCYYIRCR